MPQPNINHSHLRGIAVSTMSPMLPRTILAIAMTHATFTWANDTVVLQELKVEGRAINELDQTVTDKEIELRQTTDLEELFSGKSEVSAGGPVAMGQKLYVRNIGEDSLNITIDGAEQAGAVFHHAGRISVEPELLKRVEVEAGAAGATAGPGALGGSVRFETKDPSDLLAEDEYLGGMLKSTYSSNGDSIRNSVTVYGQNQSKQLGALFHFTDADRHNLQDGNGNEIGGTESEEALGFAKITTVLSPSTDLSLSHERVEEEGKMPYKPEWKVGPKNVPEPTEGERETTTFNLNHHSLHNDLINSRVVLYHTKNTQQREFKGTAYDGYVETVGMTLENTSFIDNHELIYGINYRDDKSAQNDVDTAPYHFSENGQVKGIYLQDNILITDAFTLLTGVRYDQYELEDVNKQTFSDGGFSPNIGVVYHLTDRLNVTANYAQALRGPEIKDAFKLSSSSNSAELKAETADNTEVGINYQHHEWMLGAGVYHSEIKDPIGTPLPWSKVYQNLDRTIETNGFYLDVNYRVNRLNAGMHFHTAETKADGQTVTRYVYGSTANSVGDTLILNLDYQFTDNIVAGWSTEIVRDLNDIQLTVGSDLLNIDKPGYTIHGLYARWQPMGTDRLTLALAVKNLFDEQYLSHASTADFTNNAG
jgi:hemoglobin/transferrin/lactoferrin receptor protein